MQSQDSYKEVKTFTYPNAIVRVHIPDLAEDERSRRMKEVQRAAQQILRGKQNVGI